MYYYVHCIYVYYIYLVHSICTISKHFIVHILCTFQYTYIVVLYMYRVHSICTIWYKYYVPDLIVPYGTNTMYPNTMYPILVVLFSTYTHCHGTEYYVPYVTNTMYHMVQILCTRYQWFYLVRILCQGTDFFEAEAQILSKKCFRI